MDDDRGGTGALAQDLDSLTDEQWGAQSLCESWRVEDVVAHMSSTAQMTPPTFFAGFMLSGFNFPRFAEHGIKTHRGHDPLETLANFRKQEHSTKSPPGPKVTWLGETIIHAEDIRRPLGIAHEYPIDAVQEVLDFYTLSDTLIRAKSRIAGLTLQATDAAWTHDEGPVVDGRLIDLLMAATGRKVALENLSGDGAKLFASRWG